MIKFLKSSFDGTRVLDFKPDSPHYRDLKKVNFHDDTRGILGDEADKKWRQEKYGVNLYPKKKSQSMWNLLFNRNSGLLLKILTTCSILNIIMGYTQPELKNDWISGI